MQELMLVEEVAAVLRLGRSTAYSMVQRGEIPGVIRLGKSIRVSREVLERFLAEKAGGLQCSD